MGKRKDLSEFDKGQIVIDDWVRASPKLQLLRDVPGESNHHQKKCQWSLRRRRSRFDPLENLIASGYLFKEPTLEIGLLRRQTRPIQQCQRLLIINIFYKSVRMFSSEQKHLNLSCEQLELHVAQDCPPPKNDPIGNDINDSVVLRLSS
ncbi:hypothetical protein DPX16_5760 [Anabarilius grahami]|uniref:Uncharacterized protein n=1 Tax=Anabarilius grahami TaxID=495550 RepID=A0A3N0Z9Y8_ANAGA|nr:hypothetical protein DPX16_5760 [Anabarilius grahami]